MRMSKKLKIVIIGPAYPYRGGIAQYNDKLSEAMMDIAEVTVISFKRLYPSWLYPGETDKETVGTLKLKSNVREVLDIYNPISFVHTYRIVKNLNPDTVLITWWTLIWQPVMALIARRLKARGIYTVFLCHNLFDHDGSALKQTFAKKLLASSNAYIVHSKPEKQELATLFPGRQVLQRMLPIYDQFPAPTKKLNRKAKLELLFFGFIRPYKGLDVLLDAMAILETKKVDAHLNIVGEYWGDSLELAHSVQRRNLHNVDVTCRYVSMDEASNFFALADVCVLPYITATGSAVVTLAYNFDTPVIASSVGSLQEAVIEGKTGWLVPPDDAEKLADAIMMSSKANHAKMRQSIRTFCAENSWQNMAEQVVDFIQK